MWVSNGGASVGLLPGRATLGPLVLMTVCPMLGLLITEANFSFDGSLLKLGAALVADPLGVIRSAYHAPSLASINILLAFAAFQLVLMRVVPGKRFVGPVSPASNRPEYVANGFQCFIISVASFLLGSYYFDLFAPTIVYDHYQEMISALTIGSFLFCFVLYVKGLLFPSSTDAGSCGNPIVDFYWGTELYPRILGWDVKQFTNCRWGMIAWAIFPLSFAAKNMADNEGTLQWAMAVNVALQLVYVAKFHYWETGYLATLDIQHDRAGFYICWGCLVWVPSVYVSHSLFLVKHSPAWFGPGAAALVFLAGWACVYINYDADRQRGLARATDGNCKIWGRKPKLLRVQYSTEKGEVKDTILLMDGWWSVSRHFHYVPEILASLCWSIPGGFDNLMPYFYVIFLTILLVDRAFRDEGRMSAKYGVHWSKYCAQVPWKIVPGVI